MFKPLALILVASLAAAAANMALAQPATPATVAAPVVAHGETESLPPVAGAFSGLAQATEAGPVASKDMTRATGTRSQTPRRVRKDYPNVMGMSLTTWMTSRPL